MEGILVERNPNTKQTLLLFNFVTQTYCLTSLGIHFLHSEKWSYSAASITSRN